MLTNNSRSAKQKHEHNTPFLGKGFCSQISLPQLRPCEVAYSAACGLETGKNNDMKPHILALYALSLALAASQARSEWLDATLTAYSPRCPHCTSKRFPDGKGANGKPAVPWQTVAADSSIPFGTRIHAFGQWWTVGDRGNRIRGRKLDLCLPSHKQAKQFGKLTAERVYIDR